MFFLAGEIYASVLRSEVPCIKVLESSIENGLEIIKGFYLEGSPLAGVPFTSSPLCEAFVHLACGSRAAECIC